MGVSVEQLRDIAEKRLRGSSEGDALDALTRALVDLGVKAGTAALDERALDGAFAAASAAGATPAQMEETVSLVSGLGVHSLMATATRILRLAQARGDAGAEGPLDPERQALWNEKVGDAKYWAAFEQSAPGFLDALLRNNPDTFRAFFDYCALPWKRRAVPARIKELVALASDASPLHRFLPGFVVHLENAIVLGVGRRAILETLDIAAACPPHAGFSGQQRHPKEV